MNYISKQLYEYVEKLVLSETSKKGGNITANYYLYNHIYLRKKGKNSEIKKHGRFFKDACKFKELN